MVYSQRLLAKDRHVATARTPAQTLLLGFRPNSTKMSGVKARIQILIRKFKGALTFKKPIDVELEGCVVPSRSGCGGSPRGASQWRLPRDSAAHDLSVQGKDLRDQVRPDLRLSRHGLLTDVIRFELALQEGQTPERVRLARIELDFGEDPSVAEEDWPVIVGLSPVRLDMDQTQRNM